MKDLRLPFQRLDELIRQGDISGAVHLLKAIHVDSKKIQPLQQIQLCNYLRRTGQFTAATKMVHRLARSEKKHELQTAAQTEYATALMFLGKTSEAKNILSSIDASAQPLAGYQLGFCYSLEWDFETALLHLDRFLAHNNESAYFNTIAQLNRQIFLAFARPDSMNLDEIQKLSHHIQQNNYALLKAVMSQVIGRYYLHRRNYNKSVSELTQGLNSLQSSTSFDRLYLQKWLILAEFYRSHKKSEAKKSFEKLKIEARALGDFETLRECDFYLSTLFKNERLASFCFHGTSYPQYKKRFQEAVHFNQEILIDAKGFNENLSDKKKTISQTEVKLPSALNSVYQSFFQDFYKPTTIFSIHDRAFPERHWNPYSSPNQIRQLVFRLRQNLVDQNSFLNIIENAENYFLKSKNPFQLVCIKMDSVTTSQSERVLHTLQNSFGRKGFSLQAFMKATQLPRRTAQRKLALLIEQKAILPIGKTRKTVYFLTNTSLV